MAQFNTGIHQYRNLNLDDYTYNPRYPWFDETNYRKLEAKIDALWLSGYEREQAMDEAYRQILPMVQRDIQMSDRNEYLNQASYEVSQITDPQAKIQANWKLSVEQLAQKVKEVYNLDPTANDQAVFNHWIQWIPNGRELLVNYLNNWDRELLYEWGLEKRLEVPEQMETSVWGIQSIINKQSEMDSDTTLWKINNVLDWGNVIGKWTERADSWIQKIPVVDGQKQAENLANKMNNLTDDELAKLYDNYVKMIENAKEWDINDKWWWEMLWDWVVEWDQKSIDRLNTLQLVDYSEAMPQEWVERNQWGIQLWDTIWDQDLTVKEDDSKLDKLSKRSQKYAKNLLNFIWWSWWGLENYAEATGVWLQKLDDIKNRRWNIPQDMENNQDTFTAYVADKTANFGEQLMDAPETLMGNVVAPNVAKMVANIPGSFVKTLSSKIRWKTNPLDSKIWLAKMLFTEEWQQALINRYWTVDNLINTMNSDPVWLASDVIDWWDKINWVFNKWTGGFIERQNIWDMTDALSSSIVKWWNIGLKTKVTDEEWNTLKDLEWNDITRDVNIAWIEGWLNRLSNWLSSKWKNGLWNLVNFENRISQTDPTQLITDPNKFAREFWETLRTGTDIFWDTWSDTQDFFLDRANRKVQNINRMTKKQQEKFVDIAWEDQWEFMNKRKLKNIDDLAEHLTNNLKQVDEAMETIEWRFKSKALDNVVEDVVKYATDTEDPTLKRLQELYNKNKEWWLEMDEINEIKRYYERTNIFDYLKSKQSKKARKSTNRDTALREWQYKMAEESWLDNLPELNKETQLTKYLLDNASWWQNGIKWNNDISLTDWIVAAWWGLSPQSIASLVGKQVYQSSWFQNKLVDVYNALGNRQYEAWPKVDMEKIKEANINRALMAAELSKVQNEQQFNNWLERAKLLMPALPYNSQYDNQEPIDYTNTTTVTPWWQSVRKWQIAEI